jgi:hypothetical protein
MSKHEFKRKLSAETQEQSCKSGVNSSILSTGINENIITVRNEV